MTPHRPRPAAPAGPGRTLPSSLAAGLLAALLVATACAPPGGDGGGEPAADADSVAAMDALAERYVELVLAVGRHDADYVDAYYGPPEWRQEADAGEPLPLADLAAEADSLAAELAALPEPAEALDRQRRVFLDRQLAAVAARLAMLGGAEMSFDEESKALYDAVAPHHEAAHFDAILARLDARLPGDGPLAERLEAWQADFVIPDDRLDAVFTAAIAACRERTAEHLELPPGESFTVEYVTDKPWSGYNWYQGDYRSLIQVNTSLPITVDRAVDLACHEGYPGHHVYNALLERDLARGRGWVEFTVYPLFSPQSLLAEGTANFGIDMAFPDGERQAYESEVLFPLAGLDPARAAEYYEIYDLRQGLSFAGNEAARGLLDGSLSEAEAAEWLRRHAGMPLERAEQRIPFIQRYRSYVINYNLGQELVRHYVDGDGDDDGDIADPATRWRRFTALLSEPHTPSGLVAAIAARGGDEGDGDSGDDAAR